LIDDIEQTQLLSLSAVQEAIDEDSNGGRTADEEQMSTTAAINEPLIT
jgi:hypothetical protein